MSLDLRLFADYFQIHVLDAKGDGDLSEAWTDEAVADDLAVASGALGLGTAVNVDVAVAIELLPQAPEHASPHVDHIVEASIHAPSGQLVILGCTDYFPDAARFDVPAGWVRVRASRWNLAHAIEAGAASDEAEETIEHLHIQVWPAPQEPPAVIKRWQRPESVARSA